MGDGKQVVIEALRRHHRDALAKAQELRATAERQTTKEESDLYLNQAEEEEAKARGYLKHAEILAETHI